MRSRLAWRALIFDEREFALRKDADCPRVVFFGSGDFARPFLLSLRSIGERFGCEICAIVTQDKGGKRDGGSEFLSSEDFPIFRASRLDSRLYEWLRSARADLFITASYGQRFPREYLDLPFYGSYNAHASLLPRWRGASPVQQSILHGDIESGVTLIRMDEQIDCGSIVRQARVKIGAEESCAELERRLADLGARELEIFITSGSWRSKLAGEAQEEVNASYARKLYRRDGMIDWRLDAEFLSRQVRAFSSWPGSRFAISGKRVLLHSARAEDISSVAGSTIGEVLRLHPHPVISCGCGALGLLRLQREGGRVCAAADFLRGYPLRAGMVLGGKVDGS